MITEWLNTFFVLQFFLTENKTNAMLGYIFEKLHMRFRFIGTKDVSKHYR